jgi:hypothetical protein
MVRRILEHKFTQKARIIKKGVLLKNKYFQKIKISKRKVIIVDNKALIVKYIKT